MALVGSFLFPVAGKVLAILGSPLINKLGLAWGMEDELDKLENTVSFIHAVLLDADEKQHQEGNHQLNDWLGKLKSALFEADDLLDDFQIYSVRHQSLHQSITGKVSSYFKPGSNQLVFQFKMSNKIQKLRQRFDEIASDRNRFNLAERLVERAVVVPRETTHSFVDESGFFGRRLPKENIIQCCLKDPCSRTPFLSIIGIGGIGKTTLVQMVYNDKRVIDHFDLRIWVCISDNFVLAKIILDILKSIVGAAESANYLHLETDQLQCLLRQKLKGRKYLLVLDDVWNEERDKWVVLMNLLTANGVAAGSKVLVTARSELVAAALAPRTRIDKLEALSDKDCLSILLTWAFAKREDANQHPKLVEIGREIVKKCKGIPLAVRTLGKLLYMKTEERDWVYVRDNDVWDSGQGEGDIMPALKLSYYQLPSHLKQCFSYCSLFPKDYEVYESEMVEIWRAHGLIRSEKFKTLKDTGKEYFALLVSRGFFQIYRYFDLYVTYKMHDLVHDLAQSVGKPDFISTTSCPILHSSIKVKHLSLTEDDDSTGDQILSELLEVKPQLRSFFLNEKPLGSHSSFNSFIETSISRFKLLRVLRLVEFSGMKLPKSIGSLRHLRFLDLAGSLIKSLPHSVCDLVFLETLKLFGCVELEKLPVGLGKLIRLECLHVTTKERCLPEKEFRCLTSLQTLWITECVNMQSLLPDDVMKCLSSLHTLLINDCRSLVSLPANGIRDLQKLENLTVGGCEKLDLHMDEQHHCSETGGERGLCSVSIFGFPTLETLPLWLLHGANALKQILIHRCPNLTTLMPEPLLENLKCLERIEIFSCPELKYLPIRMHHLTALTELWVTDCPQLVSRCTRDTGEDWHKISHVPYIFLDGLHLKVNLTQKVLVRAASLTRTEMKQTQLFWKEHENTCPKGEYFVYSYWSDQLEHYPMAVHNNASRAILSLKKGERSVITEEVPSTAVCNSSKPEALKFLFEM